MRIGLIAACLFLAAPGFAQDIPGAQADAFTVAVDDWLAGADDLAALGALSVLANDGNRAAQILLSRIETRPLTHAHVTQDLERKDRIALLRSPGGLSGKSWMTQAATDTPLAAAFVALRDQTARADGARALMDLGEIDAALLPLQDQLNYGEFDLVIALLDHPALPDHVGVLRSYAYRAKAAAVGSDVPVIGFPLAYELEWNIAAALDDDRTGVRAEALPIIPEVTALAPFAALCADICPDTAPTCTYAVAFGGLSTSAVAITSPTETLIATETYQSSARFRGDLTRLIRSAKINPDFIQRLDSCAADFIMN